MVRLISFDIDGTLEIGDPPGVDGEAARFVWHRSVPKVTCLSLLVAKPHDMAGNFVAVPQRDAVVGQNVQENIERSRTQCAHFHAERHAIGLASFFEDGLPRNRNALRLWRRIVLFQPTSITSWGVHGRRRLDVRGSPCPNHFLRKARRGRG